MRRVDTDDLPRFVEWLNDPDVRRGMSAYLPLSLTEEEKWYESLADREPDERPFAIDIRTETGWQHVGSTSFFDFDWRNRTAEFGILIGEKTVWNQGYGTETTRLMLQHAFQTLNLHRIMLRVFSHNPGARRVYEKVGFVHEGTMRQAEYQEGEYLDVHIMSVLREEWQA